MLRAPVGLQPITARPPRPGSGHRPSANHRAVRPASANERADAGAARRLGRREELNVARAYMLLVLFEDGAIRLGARGEGHYSLTGRLALGVLL